MLRSIRTRPFLIALALGGGLLACDSIVGVPDSPNGDTPLPVAPVPEGAPESEPSPTPETPSPAPNPESNTPEPNTPEPDAPEPDGVPAGGACTTWEECGIGANNTNGFECVNQACVCDPATTYEGTCASLGGECNAAACACIFAPVDVGGSCSVWQDCPPGFDSTQSGFECLQGQCTCDPDGGYATTCAGLGGYWVAAECFCVFSNTPPPSTVPDDGFSSDEPPVCWWHF